MALDGFLLENDVFENTTIIEAAWRLAAPKALTRQVDENR